MFRSQRSGRVFAVVSERSDDLKRIFESREIAITRSASDGESANVACEDVFVTFWQDRNRAIFADVRFPCGQFGTLQEGFCETHTGALIRFMAGCFDLELAPYQHQFCDDGWVVDAPEDQIGGIMTDLEFLVHKVLFDQRVRDLAAAYMAGYGDGCTYAVSDRKSD